jgi:hypothetical protein
MSVVHANADGAMDIKQSSEYSDARYFSVYPQSPVKCRVTGTSQPVDELMYRNNP